MILSVILLTLLVESSEGVTSDTKAQYAAAVVTTKAGILYTELTYCMTDNFFQFLMMFSVMSLTIL